MQIFVAGSKGASGAPQDIECSLQTWGVGANIQTKLVNPAGEVRQSVYSALVLVLGARILIRDIWGDLMYVGTHALTLGLILVPEDFMLVH